MISCFKVIGARYNKETAVNMVKSGTDSYLERSVFES